MLQNYLRISLRTLWKRKTSTVINVLGLSLGIASAIIVFLIVRYELSFDRFHERADRIYRVVADFKSPEGNNGNAGVPRPLPEALRQDFGGALERVVPIEVYGDHQQVQVAEKSFFLDEPIAYTEPAYLQLFDFPLLEGSPQTVLTLPNEIVITASLSEKLFGRSRDVLGKVISLDDEHQLKVTGVLADLPRSTDLTFAMLISFNTLARNREVDQEWDSFNSAFQTYVLLNPAVSPEAMQNQLTNYLNRYAPEEDDGGWDAFLHLQPLSSVHFGGKYGGFPHRRVPRELLAGLGLLAGLLVVLACINFINLTTAISVRRAKEVGIRKVVGSSRQQIIFYFLGEALLVTTLATGLALGLAEVGLLQLQQLYDHLQAVSIGLNTSTVVFLVALIAGVTLLAGGYPAVLLSRFQPAQIVKGTLLSSGRNRGGVRGALVVFQLLVAQLFILFVLGVGQQLTYLLEAPLGFNQEAILTIEFPDQGSSVQQRIKEQIQNHTGVQSLSLSQAPALSQSMHATAYGYDGQNYEKSQKSVHLQYADTDFFTTYQMPLVAGQVYPPSDSGSAWVANETFMREVGAARPDELLGKYVSLGDSDLPIVGVVADYHTSTFGSEIPPLLITNRRAQYQYLNLKVNTRQVQAVIEQLQKAWQDHYPDFPFEYQFLDDAIAQFYEGQQRLLAFIQLFSGIAIFIGCLGLYGLVMFMVEQRTKEIGIRKVLGASVQQLLVLFSGQFVKLLLLAFCLAAPLAYFLMRQWLQSFAYRIEINGWMFVGCLLLSLLLVLLTVGYQSVRAARTNPVESLRNE